MTFAKSHICPGSSLLEADDIVQYFVKLLIKEQILWTNKLSVSSLIKYTVLMQRMIIMNIVKFKNALLV